MLQKNKVKKILMGIGLWASLGICHAMDEGMLEDIDITGVKGLSELSTPLKNYYEAQKKNEKTLRKYIEWEYKSHDNLENIPKGFSVDKLRWMGLYHKLGIYYRNTLDDKRFFLKTMATSFFAQGVSLGLAMKGEFIPSLLSGSNRWSPLRMAGLGSLWAASTCFFIDSPRNLYLQWDEYWDKHEKQLYPLFVGVFEPSIISSHAIFEFFLIGTMATVVASASFATLQIDHGPEFEFPKIRKYIKGLAMTGIALQLGVVWYCVTEYNRMGQGYLDQMNGHQKNMRSFLEEKIKE